ncbi:uncharacterized protein LOC119371508 [Jatropha curcas]|uniref:uncharacterized protein LOC119371508 n=1 Tax=Jatropha curcas TaxID=180498 RepID=UPI0018945166|nr:uncharacterized protein LOC119371508 [Jatropha curcas]
MGELAKGLESWKRLGRILPSRESGRKREIFAQNRRSETGGDGAGPSRHTGGSISTIETARLLAEKFGREPTPIEVFTYTHTKDHDLNTFVDRRAVSVNKNYTVAREHLVSSQAESEAESRIDEVALYLEAVGGEKEACRGARRREPSTAPQPEHTDVPRSLLHYGLMLMISRDRLQNLECMSCGCPVSPMRTSSFDPAPTTDRNVSTSQQQPLPSPNPDVADDTFVTPPGTTAYPAGTPLGDPTLDRADDQLRGFDFEPF